jgi:hypothetical protein
MSKEFLLKAFKNSKNGQIIFNPKKKELSLEFLDKLKKGKLLKIKDWEFI